MVVDDFGAFFGSHLEHDRLAHSTYGEQVHKDDGFDSVVFGSRRRLSRNVGITCKILNSIILMEGVLRVVQTLPLKEWTIFLRVCHSFGKCFVIHAFLRIELSLNLN